MEVVAHTARRADSRTFSTAGSSKATSTPMMEMTTSSSISVKPLRKRLCMIRLLRLFPKKSRSPTDAIIIVFSPGGKARSAAAVSGSSRPLGMV